MHRLLLQSMQSMQLEWD